MQNKEVTFWLTFGYVTVVPLFVGVGGDTPWPGITIGVPAEVVITNTVVLPLVLGPKIMGIWRLLRPLLTSNTFLCDRDRSTVGTTIVFDTVN